MKKIKCSLMLIAVIIALSSSIPVYASASSATIVYVMRHGTEYHEKDCFRIADGYTALTLGTAYRKNYEPCKICKPPVLTEQQISDLDKHYPSPKPMEASELYEKEEIFETKVLQQADTPALKKDMHYTFQSAAIPVFVILLSIFFLFHLYITNQKKKLLEKEKKIYELNAELKFLRERIEMIKEIQNQNNHKKEENS